MPGALLTQTEAAAYLGVSRDLIRRFTKNGAVPIFQDYDGARILYPRPGLDALMDELGRSIARQESSS